MVRTAEDGVKWLHTFDVIEPLDARYTGPNLVTWGIMNNDNTCMESSGAEIFIMRLERSKQYR